MKIKDNIEEINNKSPLRYPGGKTRACKYLEEIINENFDIKIFKNIISPFFGGGSFEFYMQNKYYLNIIANDKFKPLYNFWTSCKNKKIELYEKILKYLNKIEKEDFINFREKIMNEDNIMDQSILYFIINRCSFSGSTLSGGFSKEASKKRFTKSSIDKIINLNLSNFDIYNYDFNEFLDKINYNNSLLFLDPPYYLDKKKSKLYGNNGDMHENFNHEKLYEKLLKKKNWIMTYNNCDYIKELYKNYKIIEIDWKYSMNKSKKSSEIVIIG